MWTFLASLLGGPIVNAVIAAYKAKLDAANTRDALAAGLAAKEIEAEIAARADARAIIIAEQGRWYTAIVRPLLVLPFGLYVWKIVLVDVVLGLGSTDPLRGDMATVMMIVIGSYFGGRTIEKVAQVFKR